MRIRHFGFLANCCRTQRIEETRAAIDVAQQPLSQPPLASTKPLSTATPVLCASAAGCGLPLTWCRGAMTEAHD